MNQALSTHKPRLPVVLTFQGTVILWQYLYRNCSIPAGGEPTAGGVFNVTITRGGQPLSGATLDGLGMTGENFGPCAGLDRAHASSYVQGPLQAKQDQPSSCQAT